MRTAARRFFSLAARERGCVLEAALMMLIVRMAFALLSFPRALRLLRIAPGEKVAGRIAAAEASEVAHAVTRAARHVPFRAVCLQQAFAALLMLRRRGLAGTVHLGLAHGTEATALQAHAWSRCGDMPVTGADAAQGFVPIAAFVA